MTLINDAPWRILYLVRSYSLLVFDQTPPLSRIRAWMILSYKHIRWKLPTKTPQGHWRYFYGYYWAPQSKHCHDNHTGLLSWLLTVHRLLSRKSSRPDGGYTTVSVSSISPVQFSRAHNCIWNPYMMNGTGRRDHLDFLVVSWRRCPIMAGVENLAYWSTIESCFVGLRFLNEEANSSLP